MCACQQVLGKLADQQRSLLEERFKAAERQAATRGLDIGYRRSERTTGGNGVYAAEAGYAADAGYRLDSAYDQGGGYRHNGGCEPCYNPLNCASLNQINAITDGDSFGGHY